MLENRLLLSTSLQGIFHLCKTKIYLRSYITRMNKHCKSIKMVKRNTDYKQVFSRTKFKDLGLEVYM